MNKREDLLTFFKWFEEHKIKNLFSSIKHSWHSWEKDKQSLLVHPDLQKEYPFEEREGSKWFMCKLLPKNKKAKVIFKKFLSIDTKTMKKLIQILILLDK